jgi:DNA recombination-dependent growth factor C
VPSPGDRDDALRQDAFRPFEDGLEEERLGWCDWAKPMEFPRPDWIEEDRFWVFGLRIDTRKIPGELLKAQVDDRLQALKQEKDLAFVGREARISLHDEVKADLLRKVLPAMKTFHIMWDWKGGLVYTTATSQKAQSALIGLFIKSFGCELQPLAPLLLAGRLMPGVAVETLMALEPLDLEVQP